MSLIISACTKTWNNKTKRPKRNDRCDWNKTTTTIETSGCWKVADFTSDILSHLRILHIKAVTRNLIFFSSTRAAETIIWHLQLYVVSSTERQPHWILKRIRKGEEETDNGIQWQRLCPRLIYWLSFF